MKTYQITYDFLTNKVECENSPLDKAFSKSFKNSIIDAGGIKTGIILSSGKEGMQFIIKSQVLADDVFGALSKFIASVSVKEILKSMQANLKKMGIDLVYFIGDQYDLGQDFNKKPNTPTTSSAS